MSKFRDGFIGPAVILAAIAFVTTFLLAMTYNLTLPTVQAQEALAEAQAKEEVLPGATEFEDVTLGEDSNSAVQAAYRATDGSGYVFRVATPGYGGPVTFMVGVNAEGTFSGVGILSHEETPGLGAKIDNEEYLSQYVGANDPYSVDSITGASVSSNALKTALRYAMESWESLSVA